MKKYNETYSPLKVLSESIHKDFTGGGKPLMRLAAFGSDRSASPGNCKLRRLIFTIIFLLVSFRVVAPENNTLTLFESPGIQPFSALMYATAMVETMGNPLMYNELENAVGIFQIRQVRVDEYNRRTSSNYILTDMFDVKLSEKVFLYFASLFKSHDLERIAKAWNGSGPLTELYWKRIKEYL